MESLTRRSWLRMGVGAGVLAGTGLWQLSRALAGPGATRADRRAVILLWLDGGPSQLETFDPHPGTAIAAGTGAIDTAVSGIQLAEGFEALAAQMQHVSLVRSLVSKEGDHERASYYVKNGYRLDPTFAHPSLGAVVCNELPDDGTEIPRHVSISPARWPGRGGFLGANLDAFMVDDPGGRLPDVASQVSAERTEQRFDDLGVVEGTFAQGRQAQVRNTRHAQTVDEARTMMGSEQLRAFDIDEEPDSVRARYGDTEFGRGCLAARRLVEVGVRAVEVTLSGWDTHVDNHDNTRKLVRVLDPAFAALVADLRERDHLDEVVVLCGGEFGRTPELNRLDGRDHWPHGYAFAIAGAGLRGGQVIGATDPDGSREVQDPHTIEDVHATVLTALGLDPEIEQSTPAARPIKLSEGRPIATLLG